MKTLASIALLVLVCVTSVYSQHAPYPAPRARHADSVRNAFVASWGPFDNWPFKPTHFRFGNDFNEVFADTLRYFNLPIDLGLNAEHRNAIWDYPNGAAPQDTILGGDHEKVDDILTLEPKRLFDAFDCASYMRFEFERHTRQKDSLEYPGFYNHSNTGGASTLVGHNSTDTSAQPCFWIIGSPRSSDRDTTCLKLVAGSDAAGIFDDSLWHPQFINNKNGSPVSYFSSNFRNKKLLLRFRVRVDQSVNIAADTILFFMHTKFQQLDNSIVTREDTFHVDTAFKNFPTGFDTIERRFLMPLKPADLAHTKYIDSTKAIFFSFQWPGTISMTADWMEVMTARVLHSDSNKYIQLGTDGIGDNDIAAGLADVCSAEDFLAPDCPMLDSIVHGIVIADSGHINYIRIGDEFPLAQSVAFKRLTKLMRLYSDSTIELTEFTQDSTAGIFGIGLPNQHVVDFEGCRIGMFSTSLYNDPKWVMYDPYEFLNGDPLPKRTTAISDTAILSWEKNFAPTDSLNKLQGNTSSPGHYTPGKYLQKFQFARYPDYLRINRQARRLTERNPPMRYGLTWDDGLGVMLHPVDSTAGDTTLVYGDGNYRVPTGAELKLMGHIATSCGSKGLTLYFLANGPDRDDAGNGIINGGIMSDHGVHDSNYHTFSYSHVTQSLWIGWNERYDAVKNVIPALVKYGTTLLFDTCIGDWTAAELPNISTGMKDTIPFISNSLSSIDDFGVQDAFHANSGVTPDTSNRTFVHVSMWLDKDSATKANHSDTLLYITNMRTDDSYDTTAIPTTIDRRAIKMTLRASHYVKDILDSSAGFSLDSSRVRSPFVRGGDLLQVRLLAGDGILVRLLPPPIDTTYREMPVAINFPKGTQSFNDYGRINLDKPAIGVKDPTGSSVFSIPSSVSSVVAIKDADTVRLWQDSLLYVKIDNVEKTRAGKWRNQNWTAATTPSAITTFNFKNQLNPITSGLRAPQISIDSLAHQIVIKTDLEGTGSGGKIRVKDPFLVDSATLKNVYDTLAKSSPFLPHVLNTSRGLGVDSEHYGGIFLKQNPARIDSNPMYALNAYSTIDFNTLEGHDTIPDYTDWTFLQWTTTDTAVSLDTLAWLTDIDGNKILFSKNPGIVFGKDSAIYIARYKAHTSSYTGSDTDAVDTGTCCNNQRKLFYIGKDSFGRNMWRMVYSSDGRIYTETGTQMGTNNADFVWKPEQLLSSWTDNHSHFPAMGYHPPTQEKYHFVYQDNTNDDIVLAVLDTTGAAYTTRVNVVGGSDIASLATPVIASTDFPWGPIDLVAWTGVDGIHLRAIGNWSFNPTTGIPDQSSELILASGTNAQFPTIWVDTCYICNTDTSKAKFWIAWQQDTTIAGGATVTDIMAREYQVKYGSTHRTPTFDTVGTATTVTDISRNFTPSSTQNLRPCIAGFRLNNALSMRVKLAYESLYAPDNTHSQGIEICSKVESSIWMNTNFLTSLNANDPYWKPSIEITKYHKADTGLVLHSNWYSIIHESNGGDTIIEWGFDGNTQRLTANSFEGLQDPQVAVTPDKIDSEIHRVAMSHGGSEPRWLIPGYTGAFKIAANDNLWGYHALMEKDTGSALIVESGFGELAFDNGGGMTSLDLADREDTVMIDSLHPADYFMQSENFTLPAGGTIQYCPWIRPSNDSLFASRFSSLKYALDFYDTSGAFACRIDSMTIHDTTSRIHAELRTVYLSRESNQIGFFVFHRISGTLDNTSTTTQNIIARQRLSNVTAFKRTGANILSSDLPGITLSASPNPFRNEVNIFLGIPVSGPVTIEVFNTLGNSMGYLCKERMFTDGVHQLVWQAGKLPSGVYILRMRFGNRVTSTSVVSVE